MSESYKVSQHGDGWEALTAPVDMMMQQGKLTSGGQVKEHLDAASNGNFHAHIQSGNEMASSAHKLADDAFQDGSDLPSTKPPFGAAFSSKPSDDWDPLRPVTGRSTSHPYCVKRLKRDLKTLLSDPLPGIFVHIDEADITVVHALICGPFETPYEGGFFYFILRFPDDYPNVPPKVRLMTTGGGRTRFNPNLYQCGKVCLSILGTWEGPSWSPAQTLSSVLMSIQSLMNGAPYHNEPGFETERCPGESKHYNECIEHETMRVAVCDMLEGKVPMPAPLQHVMRMTFDSFREMFTDKVKANMYKDGQQMADPFRQNVGVYRYASLLARLEAIPARQVDGQN